MSHTPPSVAFTELVRRAAAKLASSFYQHCESCGQRSQFVLLAETPTQEVYGCGNCGAQKVYTVR